jgi:MerR family transcriptional regulator, light-induced transcriptional regulator
MINGEDPLFTIGAVTRMTDIGEATLRVWERRYHFPQTARTAGGHRLYSQQEVLRLQWVKLRIDEGISPSRAIQALRQIEETRVMPSSFITPSSPPTVSEDNTLVTYQKRLSKALLGFASKEADLIIEEALNTYSIETITLEIISPTLFMIGEAWSAGQTDIATEHFASNYLRHRLLMWMQVGLPLYNVNPVALSCAPDELHEGGLLILGVLLHRLHWPVIYLGQSFPLAELPSLIQSASPSIIVFAAMSQEAAMALADWPKWIPQTSEAPHPIIGYGGRAFIENPQLAQIIPGTLIGRTFQDGIATLHRLLLDRNLLRG